MEMRIELPWIWLPALGPIRLSTLGVALLIFGVVTWRLRRPGLALVAVMAWVSAYEIVYNATGNLLQHWMPIGTFAWLTAAVAAWVILAHVLGIRPDRWVLILFACLWIAWIGFGFHSNAARIPQPLNDLNEVLNEATKTALGVAYLLGALRLPRRSTETKRFGERTGQWSALSYSRPSPPAS